MKTFRKETLYRPKKRMGKEDRGLARHTMECESGVTGETQRARGRERGLKQRKILEAIKLLRQRKGTMFLPHIQYSGRHNESYEWRGSWHVSLISFIFFPGSKATLKESRLAVLLNCSDNPFKYGIVTTPRLCGMRVLLKQFWPCWNRETNPKLLLWSWKGL